MDGANVEQAGREDKNPSGLPLCAEQFIAAVVQKMRYRRRVREEAMRNWRRASRTSCETARVRRKESREPAD